jgi:predicted TIM-barrel enzyme
VKLDRARWINSGWALMPSLCVGEVTVIAEAAKALRSDILVLCHGGPIAKPEDARFMLGRCPVEGFCGASTMEPLPAETAITAQVR